jgi:NAD(P)-dependent dehydrogenase (short-subunit alcohol dehydrogenase family)
MNPPEIKVALITGANTGIGKEIARQLGLLRSTEKIYLACRNESKAQAARQDLEQAIGRPIFEVVIMDVSDPDSVHSALSSVKEPIDALVMNAGGSGGKTPLALTKNGVTDIFAQNVLGHMVLLDSLLKSGQLTGTAVYVGSEAARGVPKMGMKRPVFAASSANEFASVCNGEWFRGKKFDSALAYGQVKYLAALWMAAAARKNPEFNFLTISPGNTQGTEVANSMPLPARVLVKYVVMPVVAPLLGMAHPLEAGAKRIVDGLTNPSLKSGVFYASKENTLTGPIVDQSTIVPDLDNETYQDNAWNAVHRFVS